MKNSLLKRMFFASILLLSGVVFAQTTIKGTVSDGSGPLPGATISVKGTTSGVTSDFDGNYQISASNGDVLVISFIGYLSKELTVGNQQVINVVLEEDASLLDEVVVVGYGTQKKVNVTGAVSVVEGKLLADRPVNNVTQALQGLTPGLSISSTTAGGEPGASMTMNIRGLSSLESGEAPYVLVDGIPMSINNINPSDVASISVLKDAAASSIYGARAAFGVILITTKSGNKNEKAQFSYNSNSSWATPTLWPELAETMDYALAMNESIRNVNGGTFYSEEVLSRLAQNIANPGSAPEMLPKSNGLDYIETGPMGLGYAANTDWESVLFNNYSFKQNHSFSARGGAKKIDYFVSVGYLNDGGLMKLADEFYNRLTFDAKLNAQVTPWAKISLVTKYMTSEEEFPWDNQWGRGRVFDMISKLKPTLPLYYPDTDVYHDDSRIEKWKVQRENYLRRQLVLSPRLILEPVKNWVTNLELNYRTNDNRQTYTGGQSYWVRPNSERAYTPAKGSTTFRPRLYTNKYVSPTIRTSYLYELGEHSFNGMIGYQHEEYDQFNLTANAGQLLSDDIPSISTAVGDKTVDDVISHWGTKSYFARLNYNFDEKYIFEANIRRDGSSKFQSQNDKWGTFPSASIGWVASKEKFFPFANTVNLLKFRASYGTLGDHSGAKADTFIANMPADLGSFLMGGERPWTIGTPSLLSRSLTWLSVSTKDIAVDFGMFNNRLKGTFEVYESKVHNQIGPGDVFPSVLGANAPLENASEVTTKGWELELAWRDRIGEVSYGIRGVLSDYTNKVTKYDGNENNLISENFEGKNLGDIWGYETAGYFQSQEDVDTWGINQSYIRNTTWFPGDMKYVDQNGDDIINQGTFTVGDTGDRKVIGNSTPRYRFAFNGDVAWKSFDASFIVQGIGKRDLDIRGATFRGPAQGKFHATVFKEHLDFWRDDTSPLGANPDAYFPRPYSQNPGNNNKNFRFATTQFMQNGAYLRLKNIQVGYTIPEEISEKISIDKVRVYFSGENLFTITDLMIFDPEAYSTRNLGAGTGTVTGKSPYPLSKSFSVGLNINF